MTYAFAAAGTGGHVFPALAVADALVSAGVGRDDIVFFGGDRMEATTIPEAGYAFVAVELRGLKRSFSLQNLGIPKVVAKARREVNADDEHKLIDRTIHANVRQSIDDLLRGSPGIKKRAGEGKVKIVGAVYNIKDGQVAWLD